MRNFVKSAKRVGAGVVGTGLVTMASAQVAYPIAEADVTTAAGVIAAVGGVIALAWGIGFLRRNMGKAG